MKKKSKIFLSFVALILFLIIAIASSNENEEKWYSGGTLHESKIAEWKTAANKNKLATCADFVANLKKMKGDTYDDLEQMKEDAEQMMNCIDEATKGTEDSNHLKTAEIASTCSILIEMN